MWECLEMDPDDPDNFLFLVDQEPRNPGTQEPKHLMTPADIPEPAGAEWDGYQKHMIFRLPHMVNQMMGQLETETEWAGPPIQGKNIMNQRLCQDEHIAYLLAAATNVQRKGVGMMGMNEECPPFFWMNQQGERMELRQDTFQKTGQMLLDRNILALREEQPDIPPEEPENGIPDHGSNNRALGMAGVRRDHQVSPGIRDERPG